LDIAVSLLAEIKAADKKGRQVIGPAPEVD